MIAAIAVGLVEWSEAAWVAAGSMLTWATVGRRRGQARDPLYPARVQLARFRRSEKPADVLVVKLPPRGFPSRVSRRDTRVASAVLRVTDGVAIVPPLYQRRLCAVIEPGSRARSAIEGRLRKACGDEVGFGWARFPEHGVTLESLIEAAADRVPSRAQVPAQRPRPQLQPRRPLAPAGSVETASEARRAR